MSPLTNRHYSNCICRFDSANRGAKSNAFIKEATNVQVWEYITFYWQLQVYKLDFHSFLHDDSMKECIGRRIRKVWLFNVIEPKLLSAMFNLLAQFEFEQLSVTVKRITPLLAWVFARNCGTNYRKIKYISSSFLVDTVKRCQTHELTLTIDNAIRRVIPAVHFIPYSPLYICQSRVDDAPHAPFIIEACDWGPIILWMFLRKLEKLRIDNPNHSDFLPKERSEILMQVMLQL